MKNVLRQSNVMDIIYGRLYMPAMCWYYGLKDKKGNHVPPATLRYKVHGRLPIEGFLLTGKKIAEDIQMTLSQNGIRLESSKKVLDFGCGCGRALIWFKEKEVELYGTDIDGGAINWCKEHLKFGQFSTNGPDPPLNFVSNFFDIIYASSVFTHLNLELRAIWLAELRRILKPSGFLLASLHGAHACTLSLMGTDLRQVQETGFIFKKWHRRNQLFPEWYQATFETKIHAIQSFSEHFRIIDYKERGIDEYQDLILVQKTTIPNSSCEA
jgi:ubiquinone/menaquinone biosynthesis C-methylase UbiE